MRGLDVLNRGVIKMEKLKELSKWFEKSEKYLKTF